LYRIHTFLLEMDTCLSLNDIMEIRCNTNVNVLEASRCTIFNKTCGVSCLVDYLYLHVYSVDTCMQVVVNIRLYEY
jgi:hypothetical protein